MKISASKLPSDRSFGALFTAVLSLLAAMRWYRHGLIPLVWVLAAAALVFALLALLARREGEVLSRTLIAEQVWDMNFDSDTNVIDVAIRRLRAKIDDAYEPKLIHTVRGMGYSVEAPDAA